MVGGPRWATWYDNEQVEMRSRQIGFICTMNPTHINSAVLKNRKRSRSIATEEMLNTLQFSGMWLFADPSPLSFNWGPMED